MFMRGRQPGRAVCVEDYGRIRRGAVVPVTNELYSDVELWVSEGNTLLEFDRHPDTRSLGEAKEEKIQEINDLYTAEMRALIKEYPRVEMQSWPQQDTESREYLLWVQEGQQGPPPATPVIDRILAGRNGGAGIETTLEISEKIQARAAVFRQAQESTGKRQRLTKLVEAAGTIDSVKQIVWGR